MKTRRILTKSFTGPAVKLCKLAPVIKKVEERAVQKGAVIALAAVITIKIIFVCKIIFNPPVLYFIKDAERLMFGG